jgi:hypothetical protein
LSISIRGAGLSKPLAAGGDRWESGIGGTQVLRRGSIRRGVETKKRQYYDVEQERESKRSDIAAMRK